MGKKLFIGVVALGVASLAFANGDACYTPAPYSPTVYVGLQGGLGISGFASQKDHSANLGVKHDYGFAGRLFAGYNFHKHYAVEAGYTYWFRKTRVDNAGAIGRVKNWALDLVGKIKTPLVDQFGLYAKAGIDYLHTKWTGVKYPVNAHKSFGNFNVVYGVGATYDYTKNISADVSWTRYNGYSRYASEKYQPHADLYAIGVMYNFDMS